MRLGKFSLLAAAALALTALPTLAEPAAIHLEAEGGDLVGVSTKITRAGFSGAGYVGDFAPAGSRLTLTIADARPGLYNVALRYSAPSGPKGYGLVVNGASYSAMLPKTGDVFATASGPTIDLKAGRNTLAIERGWGYYDIDALDLTPAPPPAPLAAVPDTLSDPKATPEAQALMRSLVSLYGIKTISGQIDAADTKYVKDVTGKTPAIYSGDFMDYSPSRLPYGAKSTETETLLRRAREGQIISALWHWNAPSGLLDKKFTDTNGAEVDASWYKGFYTNATTFDVQKAIDNPNSEEHALLLRDIDTIAVQLQKLSEAHRAVLWRPLHEAEGGWFWWGAKGPKPFVALWRLMYDRLTNRHHLHNLIWVYTGTASPDWYPGDAFVDIVGTDAYPSDPADPLSTTWNEMEKAYGGRKLLALTEFGGVPDIDNARRYGVRWSYFVSWGGDLGPKKNTRESLTRIYQSPTVITKDELKVPKSP